MDNRLEIRPATRHDIKAFFGDQMRDTCRAWSAFYDGELVCVAGVAITRYLVIVFMELRQDVPKITIWRGTLQIWRKILALNYPVMYAVANPELCTAHGFLKRLGFAHVERSARGDVFIWTR